MGKSPKRKLIAWLHQVLVDDAGSCFSREIFLVWDLLIVPDKGLNLAPVLAHLSHWPPAVWLFLSSASLPQADSCPEGTGPDPRLLPQNLSISACGPSSTQTILVQASSRASLDPLSLLSHPTSKGFPKRPEPYPCPPEGLHTCFFPSSPQ